MRYILICALYLSLKSLAAQERITGGVLSSGGGSTASTAFALRGTLGQTFISLSDSLRSGFWHGIARITTSVEAADQSPLPVKYRLEQNYPNPFNPSTTIEFAVPLATQVTITLYDMLGRQVATLVDDEYQPGSYHITFEAGDLPSGVYVYRIQAGNFSAAKKFLLMK